MQRSLAARNLFRHITRHQKRVLTPQALTPQTPIPQTPSPCDVFINHRGIDTKKNVAGLLYDNFIRMRLCPFLDNKSMKPGDKLFEKIDSAIRDCKIGIAVFSPRYCESYFCLHELSLIMESRKRVIPIFVDVKPSELRVKNGVCPPKEVEKFNWALQEAKYTVGLTFNSTKGDWSEFIKNASDAVVQNLLEVEREWPVQINGKTIRMF